VARDEAAVGVQQDVLAALARAAERVAEPEGVERGHGGLVSGGAQVLELALALVAPGLDGGAGDMRLQIADLEGDFGELGHGEASGPR